MISAIILFSQLSQARGSGPKLKVIQKLNIKATAIELLAAGAAYPFAQLVSTSDETQKGAGL